jgi:hypothetical protein
MRFAVLELLLACAKPGTVSGDVQFGLDKKAASGITVAWVAEGDASDPCSRREAVVGEDGSYKVEGICPGKSYTLKIPGWWAEAEPVEAAEKGEIRTLVLWPVPKEEGVYLSEGTSLSLLKTHTQVDRLKTPGGEELRFPLELPGSLPRLKEGSGLVLAGKATEKLKLEPLVAGVERLLLVDGKPTQVGAWFYMGREVGLEEVKVVSVEAEILSSFEVEGKKVRIFGAESVPAGRYALSEPEGFRAFLFYFDRRGAENTEGAERTERGEGAERKTGGEE